MVKGFEVQDAVWRVQGVGGKGAPVLCVGVPGGLVSRLTDVCITEL